MKHKTLFRLLLKLLGVYLIIVAVADAVGGAVWLIEFPGAAVSTNWWLFLSHLSVMLIKVGAGTYLFFGGQWVADKAIRGNRPYCHECGYDLTGAVGNRCAECGTAFAPTAIESKP